MATPKASTVWAELEQYLRPQWYDDAIRLSVGLTRLAVAYDVVVKAPDGNPEHPSVKHVRNLLLPYQLAHYQAWRERLYARSVRPELGVLFQELADAHRKAAGMVAAAFDRDEVRKCYAEAESLRDTATDNTAVRDFWSSFLDLWEEIVHWCDCLDEDGDRDDDHQKHAQHHHNMRHNAANPPWGDGSPEDVEEANRSSL